MYHMIFFVSYTFLFYRRGLNPRRLLDLGCGSGILGLAAARSWPTLGSIVFADHDPEAVATTRENAELNGLDGDPRMKFVVLDLLGEARPELEPSAFVFANIRPRVLVPAAAKIIDLLVPGGRVVLVDFTAPEDRPQPDREWLQKDLGVIWQGFATTRIREWLQEAGLSNVEVELHEAASEDRDLPTTFIASADRTAGPRT